MCFLLRNMRGKDREFQLLILKSCSMLVDIYSKQENLLGTDYTNGMIETMKRKFQRITKGLIGYAMQGESFMYSDEWQDIYRTVGGDGTFATDEAVNLFPHKVCTIDAPDDMPALNVLGLLFSTMYEETKRRGYPIETPCMADIADGIVMLRITALYKYLMSSIIDTERGRRLDGVSYGGRTCRDYVLCYNLVGCKDVRIYFVSTRRPERALHKQLTAINNPIDIFDFDMLLIKLSSNPFSNTVGNESKWEVCDDDFLPKRGNKRERDLGCEDEEHATKKEF